MLSQFLGRARYERPGEPVAHRNGYEPRKVRTTSGTVELERPRVRDASKLGFEPRVLGKQVTRSYALESLVISSFLRGLTLVLKRPLQDQPRPQTADRLHRILLLADTSQR
jgi:transposase-like protein